MSPLTRFFYYSSPTTLRTAPQKETSFFTSIKRFFQFSTNAPRRLSISTARLDWTKHSSASTTQKMLSLTTTAQPPELFLDDCKSTTEKVAKIENYVRLGGDINAKHPHSHHTILYDLIHFSFDEADTVLLIQTVFKLGAKVDFTEYKAHSPYHHILTSSESDTAKMAKIRTLAHCGLNIRRKSQLNETPLALAKRIQSSSVLIKGLTDLIET